MIQEPMAVLEMCEGQAELPAQPGGLGNLLDTLPAAFFDYFTVEQV